jgi:hypothetical protein
MLEGLPSLICGMIKTILSLGAGVQSSALALMAAHGEIKPMPDVAVFADTGFEPKQVYRWLAWLEKQLPFPVVKLSHGNIKNDELDATTKRNCIPYFFKDKDGKMGLGKRQCTTDYKIRPIEKYTRSEILKLQPKQHAPKVHTVDMWMGISLDEIQRCKIPFVNKWQRNVYPLVEKRLTRWHCLEWMKNNNYPTPPRSACLCCPFHSDKEWLKIKNGPPEEWDEVVSFDKQIRASNPFDNIPYLHRSGKPLDEVDFITPESQGQLSFLDECDGVCGL